MNCASELWRVFAPSFGKNPYFPHAIPPPHRPRSRGGAERSLRRFSGSSLSHQSILSQPRARRASPCHVATRSIVSVLSQRSASEPRDNPLPLKAISVPALADQITPQRPTPRFRAALDFWTPVGLWLAGCRRFFSVAPQSPVAKPLPPTHTRCHSRPGTRQLAIRHPDREINNSLPRATPGQPHRDSPSMSAARTSETATPRWPA